MKVFSSYPLVDRNELFRGRADDPYEVALKLTFALNSPSDTLGIGQPTAHIKVKPPGFLSRDRSYSVMSNPSERGHFSIIIKVYRGGAVSGYLSRVQLGERVQVALSRPKLILDSKNVGLIAFGIGITEMVHTAKQLLQEGRRVTLVHALPYSHEVLFNEEFQQLYHEYRDSFNLVYFFSREECSSDLFPHAKVYHGRFDASSVEKVLDKTQWAPEESRFLVIGTKYMKKSTYKTLENIGYSQKLLVKQAKH